MNLRKLGFPLLKEGMLFGITLATVFIDLVDGRYTKHVPPYDPGSDLLFNLVGVNDYDHPVAGEAVVKLLDAEGQEVNRRSVGVSVPAYGKQYTPVRVELPEKRGGYLVLVEYTPHGINQRPTPVLSRRYIKVGKADAYRFFDYPPEPLKY